MRMMIVAYCFGIRSERRLCHEVHLNLAYRGFCRLGLDGEVPDHSTFSKNRHGRFRESDLTSAGSGADWSHVPDRSSSPTDPRSGYLNRTYRLLRNN